MFSDPDRDSDLTQNGIEFINRVMSRYPEALLQVQPTSDLEFFFMFALKVLDGNEPLPKGSACEFWVRIPFAIETPAQLPTIVDSIS